MIATPNGDVPIETISRGDIVLAINEHGQAIPERVTTLFRHTDISILELDTEAGTLRTTREHPLWMGGKLWRAAGDLKPKEQVMLHQGGKIVATTVLGLRVDQGREDVFNIEVESTHTYIANNFVVHNAKTPCFPCGTMIATQSGAVAIENLALGDIIMAVGRGGEQLYTPITKLVSRYAPLLVVETSVGDLRTTDEHRLWMGGERFRPARELKSGDEVMMLVDGEMKAATVKGLRPEVGETVYNLEIDAPHVFVADGFLVHDQSDS